MQHVKHWATSFLCTAACVLILVIALCLTIACVLGGFELLYWIVTGTFFHFVPMC